MRKLFVIVCLAALSTACASSQDRDDLPPPVATQPTAENDARLAEIQTAMTELLERLDVLNDRIARIEDERTALPVVTAAPSTPAPMRPVTPAAAPQHTQQPQQRAVLGAQIADQYRKAIMLFGRGSYGEARQAFQAVFDSEPAGDLADNALFWIGETYFASRDYVNAMRFYARVTNEFADQNKAPDALFKTALAQVRTSDLALARKTLQQVIDRYPYSTSAASAKQELQRIRY